MAETRDEFKIVQCPECGRIPMASIMPDAEIDKDSVKAFRKYTMQGYKIKIIEIDERSPLTVQKHTDECLFLSKDKQEILL